MTQKVNKIGKYAKEFELTFNEPYSQPLNLIWVSEKGMELFEEALKKYEEGSK